jgi:hypothetical protein
MQLSIVAWLRVGVGVILVFWLVVRTDTVATGNCDWSANFSVWARNVTVTVHVAGKTFIGVLKCQDYKQAHTIIRRVLHASSSIEQLP